MTASSQITSVSFRGIQVLKLNSLGIPDATSVTEYAGVRIIGAKTLTLNRPEWQRIPSTGDDRVLAQFLLRPKEGVGGELRTGAFDMTAEALLSDVNILTVGGIKILGQETDQADLPDVCLVAWREAKSVASGDTGHQQYESVLIPSAKVAPRGGSFEENSPENRTFTIVTNVVDKWPWAAAMSLSTEGYTEVQVGEVSSDYIPRLSAFKGDGETLIFTFGTEAASADLVTVYLVTAEGVATDITDESYLTVATTGLTFTDENEPGATEYLVVVSEVAE